MSVQAGVRDGILGAVSAAFARWRELADVNTEWAEVLLGEQHQASDPGDAGLAGELRRVGAEIGVQVDRIRGLATGHDRYRALLTDIVGADPVDEVAAVVTDDWAALTTEAAALAVTADAFDATRRTIDQRRTTVSEADALLTACGRHAAFLRSAGSEILHLARAVCRRYTALRAALDTAIGTLVDALLIPPGRGDAYQVFGSVVLAFTEVSEIADEIRTLIHSFADTARTVAELGDAVTAVWPANPYDD